MKKTDDEPQQIAQTKQAQAVLYLIDGYLKTMGIVGKPIPEEIYLDALQLRKLGVSDGFVYRGHTLRRAK